MPAGRGPNNHDRKARMRSRWFFISLRITASFALGMALALGPLTSSHMTAPAQAQGAVISNLSKATESGIEVQTLDGKRVKLAQLAGENRPLLIDFLATSGGPCRPE